MARGDGRALELPASILFSPVLNLRLRASYSMGFTMQPNGFVTDANCPPRLFKCRWCCPESTLWAHLNLVAYGPSGFRAKRRLIGPWARGRTRFASILGS